MTPHTQSPTRRQRVIANQISRSNSTTCDKKLKPYGGGGEGGTKKGRRDKGSSNPAPNLRLTDHDVPKPNAKQEDLADPSFHANASPHHPISHDLAPHKTQQNNTNQARNTPTVRAVNTNEKKKGCFFNIGGGGKGMKNANPRPRARIDLPKRQIESGLIESLQK